MVINKFGGIISNSLRYILLAHHPSNELDHTIKIKLIKGDVVYLCARCAGLVSGLIFSILSAPYFKHISIISYPLLFTFCIIPGTLDWIYHNINKWKSNNKIRIFTGFLLGIPIGTALSSIITGNFLIFVEFAILSCIYLILLSIIFNRYPQLKEHIQEYDDFASRFFDK